MLELLPKVSLGAAGVLAPLTDALGGPGKSLTLSPALDSTLPHTKNLFAYVPELVHPRPGAQVSLAIDASDSHVGSVLQQLLVGSWATLAFFSKKLSIAEQKYSDFNRELLATYSSFWHFRFPL